MSEPTKKPAKKPQAFELLQKPSNLVVDILSLKDLGEMIARDRKIAPGSYDLVIEYKMGASPLGNPNENAIPAIGVALGGLGLRKSDKPGPLTINVT